MAPRSSPRILRTPRPRRAAEGGLIYRALNWANARLAIFQTDEDYAAFQRVLAEAVVRHHTRQLAYWLVPNHFHVLLWPREEGDFSRFMSWLTMTHTQRWHAHQRTAGTGHLDQGRFKSFPVQSDEHFLTVCRDVERNALRANLVGRAEDWRWGSLGAPRTKDDADRPTLTAWPIDRPRDWTDRVNRPFGLKEEEAVRRSIQLLGGVWRVIGGRLKEEEAVRRSIHRGQPYGSPSRRGGKSLRGGSFQGRQMPLAIDVHPSGVKSFQLVFPTCFMANSTVLGLTLALSAHA